MSKFCIVFLGETNEPFKLDTVKNNFKQYFKLSEIQTKYLFSGKEITLKKNLNQEEALQFAIRIDEMGGVSYIDSMEPDLQLPDNITQDRRLKERRMHIDRRHHARSGIGTDRRINHQRRKTSD